MSRPIHSESQHRRRGERGRSSWVLALLAVLVAAPSFAAEVREIRVGRHPTFSRVVFELDQPAGYRVERREQGGKEVLVVTLDAGSRGRSISSRSEGIARVELRAGRSESVAQVDLRRSGLQLKEMILANPPRIVLDVVLPPEIARPAPKPKPKVAEKKPEPKPKPKVAEKKPEPKPKPKVAEKKPEPKPKPKIAEARPEPKPAPKAEPKPAPKAKVAEVKPAPKPAPEPKVADVKPAPKPAPEPKVADVKPAPKPAPEPKVADVKPAPKPAPKPVAPKLAQAKPAPAPETDPEEPKPLAQAKPAPTPKAPKPIAPKVADAKPTAPAPDAKTKLPAEDASDAKTKLAADKDASDAKTKLAADKDASDAKTKLAADKDASDAKTKLADKDASDAKTKTAADVPAARKPQVVKPSAPKASEKTGPDEPSFVSKWLSALPSNQLVWGTAAGVLFCVIGVVALLVSKRRKGTAPGDLDVTTMGDGSEEDDGLLGFQDAAGASDRAPATSLADFFDEQPDAKDKQATPPTPKQAPPQKPAKPDARKEAPETSFEGLFDESDDSDAAPAATKGDTSMTQGTADLPADRATTNARIASSPPAGGDKDLLRVVHELERRMSQLEGKLEEANEARERLERQVAAQSEELRVQRAAIARTQRALRTMSRGDEDKATEPALKDADTQTRIRQNT